MNSYSHRVLIILFVLNVVLGGSSLLAAAEEDGHVGIVIRYDDETIETRCVPLSADITTGFDTLLSVNIPVGVEYQSGGQLICQIEDTGCSADDCFCACRGGESCVYWSYWHLIDGEWRYSTIGAGQYQIRHGSVEGWSWGPGSITDAIPPPAITYEEICGLKSSIPANVQVQSSTMMGEEVPISPLDRGRTDWMRFVPFAMIIIFLTAVAIRIKKKQVR